ncbi:MAG TPA: efflux transporter outer membrane subunit [Phycisphaerae bacterium]|jgi:multidrug efflux system outer membrane protein|nr:efflux transporter outer membrane subunit [Phycisphaerae bacterium]HOJ53051.1 efflux transporter outer membrane subunit [Phycisphaerae bacterium]HOL24788.1 efflux transporter outer membrane subunit [Phycisphaerae bacterium]HPP19324.1 efflux transporter outer membrane subunit [Phycisphaerae bacterium]HPU31289.1 efflux transporter outer membrane subunit [Phycisphaerae bacterium]
MWTRRFLACFLLMTIVAGCKVGPNYEPPQTPAPANWSGLENPTTRPAGPAAQSPGPTTRPADLATWWQTLRDPLLDELIEQAVESNLDLRIARARVAEARATRGIVAADLWPQVNLGSSYSYQGRSLNAGARTEGGLTVAEQARNTAVNAAVRRAVTGAGGAAATPGGAVGQAITGSVANLLQGNGAKVSRDQNLFQLGFDASWELDVFGGNRRAVEAADADIGASEASHRDVLVTLISEVALNYVQLRGFQRRLDIALENIRIQQESLNIAEDLLRVGFENQLAVDQARAQLATTQSQLPLLRSAIRQTIYQLSVLLGQTPGTLLSQLEPEGSIPKVPEEVPMGLPSDLLRRRPDIRTAERQLAAATARVGEAISDLFPKFSINASIGPSSRTMRHFFDRQSLGWSIGPGVTWPVFDGWRIRSNIAVQNARQEQALALYEQTVLVAFQEVENALVAYQEEQIRYQSLIEAVQASQEATEISVERFRHGQTNFLDVLESQRSLYASQDALIESETTVITNLISLYKALGGGWELPVPVASSE